ncbi:MAG: haloacid dehalogenase-like hydrolase [Elusimicrobia bacterium]|nr:haloacid dehalogenase-like hydrolase [Elusimicrobiota bacterium]
MITIGLAPLDALAGTRLARGAWTADNYHALAAFLHRSENIYGPKVAVFDFDNTCILNDIGDAVFYYMTDEALFDFETILADPSLWAYFAKGEENPVLQAIEAFVKEKKSFYPRYRKTLYKAYDDLCDMAGNETCYGWVVRLQAGKTPYEMRQIAARALKRELKKPVGRDMVLAGEDDRLPLAFNTGIRPYQEISNLMRVLKGAGFDIWIVSASGQYIVEAASRKLFGVPAQRVIGVRSRLQGGRLSADIELMTYRAGKVRAIDQVIGFRPLFAAGDSDTDWEMLDYAQDLRLVIDRGKAVSRHAVEEKATGKAWLIQPKFLQ